MGVRRADLVIENADVYTMDASQPRATAVAMEGGRVVAVGDDAAVSVWKGQGTSVIDAGGRTALPGFIDSHTHFHRASLMEAEYINFARLTPRSLTDVLEAVRAHAETVREGDWVQGDSLDHLQLRERRFPTRYELDSVCPRSPVVVRGVGRHVVAANSLALSIAGIDRSTEDPPGGRIERDGAGEPTGVLHERGKLRLDATQAETVVPPLSEAQRVAALKAGFRRLQSLGITTIHDIQREPREISDYIRLRGGDELGARIRMYPRVVEAQIKLESLLGVGLTSGFGDDFLRLTGMKVSVDGNLTIGNAALYDAYPDDPSNFGLVRVDEDELRDALTLGHAAGLPIAVHAIGQRAVDIALNAFEHVLKASPGPHRHRLEHGYMPPLPGQLKRMAELGLILSTQPSILFSEGDSWITLLGQERVDGAWPMRSAIAAGLRVLMNSDYPCSPLDPLVGLQTAVTRRTRGGVTIGASEAVTPEEAVSMMTAAPAYAAYEEHRSGTLRPGTFGDAVLLSANPFSTPADEWQNLHVDATVLGGELVYERTAP